MSVLGCAKLWVLIQLYLWTCALIQYKGIWAWANEWDIDCENPPLPVNQSGAKVVVAGWAKSGTWTMSYSLWQLGYNSYHSTEFLQHVWTPMADEHWMRPENGGRKSRVIVPFTLPVLGAAWPQDDITVLDKLKTETLAKQMSKCRVEAVTMDGLEHLHSIMLEASPDAKVILLDWRKYESWQKSSANMDKWMGHIMQFLDIFYLSLQFLPYGIIVKAIDPFIKNDIEKLLKTGGPPFMHTCSAGLMLWHPFVKNRKIHAHWFMGLSKQVPRDPPYLPLTEEGYYGLFEEVKAKVPANRLLSWDWKEQGWEELCSFLEIKDCPYAGKIETEPNGYTDSAGRLWEFNCAEPLILIPLYIFLHLVNFKIFRFVVLTLPGLLLGRGGREKTD